MRFRARLVLALYSVALAAPAVVMAGPLGDDDAASGPMPVQGPPPAQAAPHHHKGLFGRRHCVECQRAYAKAHDGVDVPAPPSLEPGMQGAVIRSDGHCPTCQGNAVVSGPVMSQESPAPGYAVVGGPAGPESPGYAVVGEGMVGSEPAPVGVSRLRTAGLADRRGTPMGGRPGAGPVDPSVVPTGLPPRKWPLPRRLQTGRTSSATCSACPCSAPTAANESSTNATNMPPSPTATTPPRSRNCLRPLSTAAAATKH